MKALGSRIFLTPVEPEKLERKKDTSFGVKGGKEEYTLLWRVVSAGDGRDVIVEKGVARVPLSIKDGDVVLMALDDERLRQKWEKENFICNGERVIAELGWDPQFPTGNVLAIASGNGIEQ